MREVRQMVPKMRERAFEHDRDSSFPKADFNELREAGLLGIMVPGRLKGMGATFREYVDVAYHLGRGNGATGLIFNMHAGVTGALATVPDELAEELGAADYPARRDEVLTGAVNGSLYAVAMSERGVGSRLSKMASRYRRVDGGFHLTADKAFVSGAGYADAYLVAARSIENPDTISQLLVPATDGVTVEPTWDTMGMRATGSHDVHFDVTLPPTALVGGVEGITLLAAQIAPHWMVASYAAVYIGVARAAIEAAVEQANQRNLATLPSVRARLGRADAMVSAALSTLRHAASLVDAGDPDAATWVWRAKLLAGDVAAATTASMMEVAGASAIRTGNPLERLFRDARCGALQPATSDVCADWLGVTALGGDPYATSEPRW